MCVVLVNQLWEAGTWIYRRSNIYPLWVGEGEGISLSPTAPQNFPQEFPQFPRVGNIFLSILGQKFWNKTVTIGTYHHILKNWSMHAFSVPSRTCRRDFNQKRIFLNHMPNLYDLWNWLVTVNQGCIQVSTACPILLEKRDHVMIYYYMYMYEYVHWGRSISELEQKSDRAK